MDADEIFAAVVAEMDKAEGFGGPVGLDYIRLMSKIADEAALRSRNALLDHLVEMGGRSCDFTFTKNNSTGGCTQCAASVAVSRRRPPPFGF